MLHKVKVLVCRVGRPTAVEEIDDSVEAMQSVVGGHFEGHYLEPGVYLFCHSEGKLIGFPPNRPYPLNPLDIVCGDFIITRADPLSGETIDVTDADIEKWKDL